MQTRSVSREELSLVLDFAEELGEQVLIRGGELWRVEQVLESVFASYDIRDYSIFMLPHTLIISARTEGDEPVYRQRQIGSIVVSMDELSNIYTLVRQIILAPPIPQELPALIHEAEKAYRYPRHMTLAGMMIALLSLNYFIGGGIIEAVFVVIGIAIAMGTDLYLSSYAVHHRFLLGAAAAFITGVIDMAAFRMGFISDPYLVMVITSIGLVPGIPLINSFREMLNGRVMCGALMFLTAFMETLAVACGFAVAISLIGG